MNERRSTLSRPFPDAEVLGLDIETNGLSPIDNDIICIAISDGTSGVVFDVRPSPFPALDGRSYSVQQWLLKDVFDRKLVIHNASFDIGFLVEKYGVPYPPHVWDTMLAEQLLTAGIEDPEKGGMPLSSSLAAIVKRRYNVDLDKSLQTSFTLDEELTAEQVDYALHDVYFLPKLAEQQRRELSNEQLGVVWDIEKRALPVFAEMVRTGVWIDLDILNPLLEDVSEQRDVLMTHLQTELGEYELARRIAKRDEMQDELDEWLSSYEQQAHFLEECWQINYRYMDREDEWETYKWLDETIDKKDGKPKGMKRYVKAQMKEWRVENPRPSPPRIDESPINLNSQQQVLAALGDVGVRLPDLQSKTIQAQLAEIPPALRDQVVVPLLKYKKAEKLVTAFGEKLIEKIGSDGRLRGNFRQIGTATGRPTCNTPNLLQIPADKRFRRAFRAGDGKLMVVADYSQMELRILAELSGDVRMQKAFAEGLDLHTYTASLMFNLPFDSVPDQRRKIAKIINFGICYGMGPTKLQATLAAEGIYISVEEARAYIDGWISTTYPEAGRWLEQQQMHALSRGYTATPLGRRRRFDVRSNLTFGEKGAIRRRGANHVIQGANADVTKLAMSLITENLGGRGAVVLQVYDEIVVEVDADVAVPALEVVRESMAIAARTILTTVPAAVDAVVSYSWSEDDLVAEDELEGLYLLAG